MKPLFTIHGGEYLFGNELEKQFPKFLIWVPTKDDGIDFLVSDINNKKPLSFQIKNSKDFNWKYGNLKLKPHVKSAGWYGFKREKLENSKADYWVFVNYDVFKKGADYIFFKPKELLTKLDALDRKGPNIVCYILVTNEKKCYETRNFKKNDFDNLPSCIFDKTKRDLKLHLERWDIIEKHYK